MRGRWAGLLSLLPVIWAGCAENATPNPAKAPPAAGPPPNILLISIDTLRADHLGCYGYSRRTSPRIDQLAAEGAMFHTVISSTSWTLPAHACMFTGLADTVHGCFDIDRKLPDDRETLAERLKAAGYHTVGFFSGPFVHPSFGVAQGFDAFIDCTSYAELTVRALASGTRIDGSEAQSASLKDITNPRLCGHVQEFLHSAGERPFFAFVHMWDVHLDYIPPAPFNRMFDPDYQGSVTGEQSSADPARAAQMPRRDLEHVIALYDGEIAWTDLHVGRILDTLDARGFRANTLVVLTSDHGEEFCEHGHLGHRKGLYDEVLRVPLIIRYPGQVAPGQRLSQPARLMDLLPTILELAGLPASDQVMGQSLVPALRGGQLAADTLAVSELYTLGWKLVSYRRPDRKLIYDVARRAGSAFDLLADPGERQPLPEDHPYIKLSIGEARRATSWLAEYRGRFSPAPVRPDVPEAVRRQLEGLGYLEGGANQSTP